MESGKNELSVNEKITEELLEDKDFCLKIVSCKDSDEVKKFLASHGIDADDNDIDVLAKSISEVEEIYKKLDDKDLDKIVGGQWNVERWKSFGRTGAKIVGIGALAVGGLMILTFIGAGIKKLGDEKGWWNKNQK